MVYTDAADGPTRDNRPRRAAALTVDELAERVGMTVRNLREWKTLGLLPPAEMRGRVGYYPPEVVDRVERIKKLHAEGFTLELIGRMLDAGRRCRRRGDATRREPPGPVPRRRRRHRRGPHRPSGSPRSPARSRSSACPSTTSSRPRRGSGRKAEEIAEIFEEVWLENIWQPFIDAGMPESELPRLQDTAARVKPLAVDAVIALFTSAMDAQIERGIARELGRLDSRRTSD